MRTSYENEKQSKDFLINEVGKSHSQMISHLNLMQQEYMAKLGQIKQGLQTKYEEKE